MRLAGRKAMMQFLKLCAALAVIVLEVLLGTRTFFPQAFSPREDIVDEMLAEKKSVLDRLSPEDLAYLAKNPVINVGVDPNFYPLEMFDERGLYSGLGADYMRLLRKMTGLEFKPFYASDWATVEEEAQKGNIDVFMAAAKTGRRSNFMLFTPPYIQMPGIIMTRRGAGLDQAGLKDLVNKKVAVTKDYAWHDFLKEFHPDIEVIPARNTLEALHFVADGKADAVLDYEFNLLEKIQSGAVMQMQNAGKVEPSYGHAIAVRHERPELFDIISVALSQITSDEHKKLAKKWLERGRQVGEERHWQWIFFFFTQAVLLCLGLNWLHMAGARKESEKQIRHLCNRLLKDFKGSKELLRSS